MAPRGMSRLADVRRIGVVGGGILGLALAAALVERFDGVEVVVFEKEERLASHQTGRNSGVVHAGLYYTPGSLKARLCVEGVGRLREFCAGHGIGYQACGKVVVALEPHEEPLLDAIAGRAAANGVPDLAIVGPDGLRDIEPAATGRRALHSPHTAIVDFAQVARQLAANVRSTGSRICTGAEVTGISDRPAGVRVHVGADHVEDLDLLVNCGGLHADRVARMAGDERDPQIVPFRGEYLTLSHARRSLVRGLIYPVPDPRYPFLGVHLTKRIDGQVWIGPNAVLALSREGYGWGTASLVDLAEVVRWRGFRELAKVHWRTGIAEMVRSFSRRRFVQAARRYVPELTVNDVRPGPAGVRAQALGRDGGLVDDFRITEHGRVISLRNAPSPAATSSLAIATHMVDWLEASTV